MSTREGCFRMLGLAILAASLGAGALAARDCDRNGVDDAAEILSGARPDCNGNGVPDGCEFLPILDLAGLPALPVGENPASVLIADLDGDSRPDLVAKNLGPWDSSTSRNVGATLSVFLNRGSGEFEAAAGVPAGDSLYGFASGDLDGDGELDLAIANFGKWNGSAHVGCAVSVLPGRGDGSFAAPVRIAEECSSKLGLADLAAADLDGDGDLDLAAAESVYGGVTLLRNEGGLAFTLVGMLAAPHPRFVKAADLDGDRVTDLVAVGSENTFSPLTVLLGEGAGKFARGLGQGAGPFAWDPQLADLDGDGDLDLAVASYQAENVSVLWNSGGGVLSPRTLHPAFGACRALAAADLDGDGDVDLACAGGDRAEVSVLFNRGEGTFAVPPGHPTELKLTMLAAADLDGDGDPDLAGVSQSEGRLLVLLNRPAPTLSADCNRNGVPDACDLEAETSSDRNADGIPDECPICPEKGDTHCVSLEADVDWGFSSGTVHARARAVDESGDTISYRFTATGWAGTRVIGPQPHETAAFIDLQSGPWTIAVLVDDDPACPDEAPDSSRTIEVYIPHVDFMLRRGEVHPDGALNIADAIVVFAYLFLGSPLSGCLAAADANADGAVDISDGVHLLSFMFLGGPAPPPPFPECGFTGFESDWRLGCSDGWTGC